MRTVSVVDRRGRHLLVAPHVLKPNFDAKVNAAAPLVDNQSDQPRARAGEIDDIAPPRHWCARRQELWCLAVARDELDLFIGDAELNFYYGVHGGCSNVFEAGHAAPCGGSNREPVTPSLSAPNGVHVGSYSVPRPSSPTTTQEPSHAQ